MNAFAVKGPDGEIVMLSMNPFRLEQIPPEHEVVPVTVSEAGQAEAPDKYELQRLIDEVARFVGVPAENVDRFLGALNACGYGIRTLAAPVAVQADQREAQQTPSTARSGSSLFATESSVSVSHPPSSGQFVRVPREPTNEMIDAACKWRDLLETDKPSMCDQYVAFYKAMLSAAPAEQPKNDPLIAEYQQQLRERNLEIWELQNKQRAEQPSIDYKQKYLALSAQHAKLADLYYAEDGETPRHEQPAAEPVAWQVFCNRGEFDYIVTPNRLEADRLENEHDTDAIPLGPIATHPPSARIVPDEHPREFEYLLNVMENAASCTDPYQHGYGEKRKAVLAYVAALKGGGR